MTTALVIDIAGVFDLNYLRVPVPLPVIETAEKVTAFVPG